MKHVIIIGAALLASVVAAQAAPRTAGHHPVYRQAASSSCLTDSRHIADVIDSYPFMGPEMHKLAAQMRVRCVPNHTDHSAPLDFGTTQPDPSPPSTGPDTAGMNTPTNPTWPGFDP
jgi:hypothetical protein